MTSGKCSEARSTWDLSPDPIRLPISTVLFGHLAFDLRLRIFGVQTAPSFDWDDLARPRKLWPRRLLVNGITRPEDAERCIAAGADGVILSSHGGRQLDKLCLAARNSRKQHARGFADQYRQWLALRDQKRVCRR
jgi:hypothetical protein